MLKQKKFRQATLIVIATAVILILPNLSRIFSRARPTAPRGVRKCALTLLLLGASGFGANAGEIDQAAALKLLQQPATVLIDVRTADEFRRRRPARRGSHRDAGPGPTHGALAPAKDTPIVVYCRSGRRSSAAQDVLEGLGYSRVVNAGAYETLRPGVQSRLILLSRCTSAHLRQTTDKELAQRGPLKTWFAAFMRTLTGGLMNWDALLNETFWINLAIVLASPSSAFWSCAPF